MKIYLAISKEIPVEGKCFYCGRFEDSANPKWVSTSRVVKATQAEPSNIWRVETCSGSTYLVQVLTK